jgi:serine phosphatase RsbU (regulator of sigma subunit)
VLGVGDSLALYTDGLAEAQAPSKLLSGEQMMAALAERTAETAGETISTLLGLVDLTQGARDDIAILVVRIAAAQSRGVRAA